jgi:hypothetical protein
LVRREIGQGLKPHLFFSCTCGPAEAVPLLQSCRIWWPEGVFPQAVKPLDFMDHLRHPSTSLRAGSKAVPFQNNAATEVFQQAAAYSFSSSSRGLDPRCGYPVLLPPRIRSRIGLFHSLRFGDAGGRLTYDQEAPLITPARTIRRPQKCHFR